MVSELFSKGFSQSKNVYSLFIKRTDELITFVVFYVDDIILTRNSILLNFILTMYSASKIGEIKLFPMQQNWVFAYRNLHYSEETHY